MTLQLREAHDSDEQAISSLSLAAFGAAEGREIAGLISDLMVDPTAQPLLSLVATADDRVVGHILFTHVHLEQSAREVNAAILAPLAVHPDYQKQGIGGRLINEGLERLEAAGVELVFVLGHPGYYPRCGFAPAGEQGLEAPYPIAPENAPAWMVQALRPDVLGHVRGRVRCADVLNDPKYWQE